MVVVIAVDVCAAAAIDAVVAAAIASRTGVKTDIAPIVVNRAVAKIYVKNLLIAGICFCNSFLDSFSKFSCLILMMCSVSITHLKLHKSKSQIYTGEKRM